MYKLEIKGFYIFNAIWLVKFRKQWELNLSFGLFVVVTLMVKCLSLSFLGFITAVSRAQINGLLEKVPYIVVVNYHEIKVQVVLDF